MSDHSSHLKNLSDLNPKKLEIIEFVISNCQGKPLELILPDLMAAASRLSEQGLSSIDHVTLRKQFFCFL